MTIYPGPHNQSINQLSTIFNDLQHYCSGYHIDVMDGHFVPHSMGSATLLNQIRTTTKKQLWIHLMVKDPLSWIQQLTLHPGDIVSAHYSALHHNFKTFTKQAKTKQLVASLALSPQDTVEEIEPIAHLFNHFLIMSVEPGKSGQQFLPETYDKIKDLQEIALAHNHAISIAVDGGINQYNLIELNKLNVDAVAVTSTLFSSKNPQKILQDLSSSINK